MAERRPAVLAIDVGGTFTDVLWTETSGESRTAKLKSDNTLDLQSICSALSVAAASVDELRYSTTVALNALLSGDLPPIGLVTTGGFRDVLESARLPQSAGEAPPERLPRRLVALENVYEVSARMAADGSETMPVDRTEIVDIVEQLNASKVQIVAVCLLHSCRNSRHESEVAAEIGRLASAITVVCSCDVLREPREYERTLATALNACLIPKLLNHVNALQSTMASRCVLRLMQANGGLIGAATGLKRPLTTALSGPCAAVMGMSRLAKASGYQNLITLDVGGTSTDVALIEDGEVKLTTDNAVAGFPLRLPMIDVLSVGAGGGSIAYQGADNRWHVGPQSAGADPGPACYGLGGDQPTLTDAHLLLGRIPPALLGGEFPLDRDAAARVYERFAAGRGFDRQRAARGVLEIASHHMCGAIRRVSVARGIDPRGLALMAGGGAGPLHGAEIADLLGVSTVVIPPLPGLATAWGLMAADLVRDFSVPFESDVAAVDVGLLSAQMQALQQQARSWLDSENVGDGERVYQFKMDFRYAGMMHESIIECPDASTPAAMLMASVEAFHAQFEQLTGRVWRDREETEIVNLRLTARGTRLNGPLQTPTFATTGTVGAENRESRPVGFLGVNELIEAQVIERDSLSDGTTFYGPAIVEQFESTTVVPERWRAEVDDQRNLILTTRGKNGARH